MISWTLVLSIWAAILIPAVVVAGCWFAWHRRATAKRIARAVVPIVATLGIVVGSIAGLAAYDSAQKEAYAKQRRAAVRGRAEEIAQQRCGPKAKEHTIKHTGSAVRRVLQHGKAVQEGKESRFRIIQSCPPSDAEVAQAQRELGIQRY